METPLKKQIYEAADAYMKTHKMSQADLAKNSGVNASYLIAMQKEDYAINSGAGKMTEISDKWFIKLAEYVGFSLEKTYWETRITPQFKRMLSDLETAKQYAYTNVIIGQTGCGKTFTINKFRHVNPTDVFVITCGSSDNLGDFIDKILDEIHIAPARTKSKKLRDIASYMFDMKMKGFSPVIGFDEAEYMKQPTLCSMKELYDHLYGFCSIVMIGTEQLLTNIEIMRKKEKTGIPQFYRRIKFGIVNLPPINRSFNDFLNGFEPKLKSFLQENCDNYGELHDVLVPAMREADRLGEPLTESLVRKILNMPEIKRTL